MKIIMAYKANISPDAPDNATVIKITDTLPELVLQVGGLEDWQRIELAQARKIDNALRKALPGGVYHRLLGVMMLSQASDWCVAVKEEAVE